MDLFFRRLLPIIVTGIVAFPLFAAQNNRMTIAVLDLDPTGVTKSDAQFLSDRFRTELFETGKFQIVEREKMNEILDEQGFQQSGCTSVECAVEIGQLLNVQTIVAGSIGKIEDLYSISVRMIDVGSGAIIRTATKDYEGRLSEVLTEIVPELARELAAASFRDEDQALQQENEKDKNGEKSSKRFTLMLEGGLSSLTFSKEINKEIEKINANLSPDIDELGAFFSLGLEVKYTLSSRWKLKIGFNGENPLSDWKTSLTEYTPSVAAAPTYRQLDIERINRFVCTYLGAEYRLWGRPDKYDISFGLDLGATALSSELRYHYQLLDGTKRENSEIYKYSSVTLKVSVAGSYYLNGWLSAGIKVQFKSVQNFDFSDQTIRRELPTEMHPIFFPEELNASGLLLAFTLGFHF